MRRIATILLMAMICLISCGDNVAEYIYPYVEFEETEDGTAGVRLLKAIDDLGELPDKAVVNGSSLDVDTFLGYSEKAASDARKLTLSSNIRKIGRNALSNTSLEELVIEGDVDISEVELPNSLKNVKVPTDQWASLPDETVDGYKIYDWTYKDENGDDKSIKDSTDLPDPAPTVYPDIAGKLTLSSLSYSGVGEVSSIKVTYGTEEITLEKNEAGTFSYNEELMMKAGTYSFTFTPYNGDSELPSSKLNIVIESGKTTEIASIDISNDEKSDSSFSVNTILWIGTKLDIAIDGNTFTLINADSYANEWFVDGIPYGNEKAIEVSSGSHKVECYIYSSGVLISYCIAEATL